jgi:hypothetical protein
MLLHKQNKQYGVQLLHHQENLYSTEREITP